MLKLVPYSFSFIEVPVQMDWTKDGSSDSQPDTSDAARLQMLDHLFGQEKTTFRILKQNKHDADTLPCTVLAHPERIVLLRLENPKQEVIYDKRQAQPGEVARIDIRDIPSFPYLYVILDLREGGSKKVAISVASDAWRNLDIVAKLIEENVNRLLSECQCGFGIELKPETLHVDFVSHSRMLIKKKKMSVQKMTIYLTHGLINPKVEEVIKEDPTIRIWLNHMYKAQHGEFTLIDPDSNELLKNNARLLEHMGLLIGSDPSGQNFRMKMTYSDGRSYTCGKDIRMEFEMNDMTFSGILGVGVLFPEDEISRWFDNITQEIIQSREESYTYEKRTRKSRKTLLPA